VPISLALASIFGSYADHENRVVLAEKDIVPDNYVKKEKVQRGTSEQHDVPSFGVKVTCPLGHVHNAQSRDYPTSFRDLPLCRRLERQ